MPNSTALEDVTRTGKLFWGLSSNLGYQPDIVISRNNLEQLRRLDTVGAKAISDAARLVSEFRPSLDPV